MACYTAVIRILDGNLIASHAALAALSLPQVRDIFDIDPNFNAILQLWPASSIFVNPSTTTTGSRLNFSANAGLLAQ